MKAVLLDGSPVGDDTGSRIRAALEAHLVDQGWDVEPIDLRERKIGSCAGDFYCWVRSPGVCNVDDDNRAIAEQLAACDLAVYLTPVTFGGYASTLKRMVDRQIQNVLPFFAQVGDETHHAARYPSSPDLLAVGWTDAPDAEAEAVFRHLVGRNAINFHARRFVADVVRADESDDDLASAATGWLDELRSGHSSDPGELPVQAVTLRAPAEIRRALLLVGSPKTRKSTSNSLGGYLYEQLAAHGVETETIYLHTVVHSPARMQALLDAVDAADLVTLAFPLYVDSLPAPVIKALERIAADRRDRAHRRQVFTAIANSGFPEARQNATALAICRIFALQAGFEWAGALALGGGAAVAGAALTGGKNARIRASLDLAAGALAQGRAVPAAAQDLLAKPLIPHRAYRLMGSLGWNRLAIHHGAWRSLKRQPYTKAATRPAL
jgi:multimeric flavodoxin WrbA